MTDKYQDPTMARFYCENNIIYKDPNGQYTFSNAGKELFVFGAVEEKETTTSEVSADLLSTIQELEGLQIFLEKRASDLRIVGFEEQNGDPTWLLTTEENPRCVVEVDPDDLLEINMEQLADEMKLESGNRGLAAPLLLVADAPYFAFI